VSSRQWEAFFGTMGWSGPSATTGTAGPFGVGCYSDGHSNDTRAASPLDQLQYLVEGKLRADELFTSYCAANKINRHGVRPLLDVTNLPRTYVYGGAVDGELITLANNIRCDVFVEVVFAVTSVLPASPGGASLASLMDYVAWLLIQDQTMSVMTTAGPQWLTETVSAKPFATSEIEEKAHDGSSALVAFSQTVQFTFTALTDYRTGRFSNLP